MDSIDKNKKQKEDNRRISKGSDHSLDRQISKKTREKGAQNRRTDKSISTQKSPFKSKYVGDKQYTRTPFGHSGLSSKSFSRRHIQDSGTTFYAKPAKFGKIAKELKKQPVDVNVTVKTGKSLKSHSPLRATCDDIHQDDDQLSVNISQSGSSHISSSDKSSSRSPDNPPRHRKCYTNSKHAEFAKHLKLHEKGLTRDIKVSQSVGNLKKSGSSGDEIKYGSADDIHSHLDKEDAIFAGKDLFSKGCNAYKNIKSECLINSSVNVSLTNPKPLAPTRSEIIISTSSTDVKNTDFNMESNQSRSNLNYFYKGTDNKMHLEGSDISGVKILLRGDLLGALNCLFPQLNLVASEANPKRPQLDPNFSYFSDSSDVLIETFALARKLYNEQGKKSAEFHKKSTKENGTSFLNASQDERVKSCYFKDQLRHCSTERETYKSGKTSSQTQCLSLRNIVSAKEIHTPHSIESNLLNQSSGDSSQNILKCSQSEPRITTSGSHQGGITKFVKESHTGETNCTVSSIQDHQKSFRTPDIIREHEKFHNFQFRRTAQENSHHPTTNCSKRSLYSSVLKNSMFKENSTCIEQKEAQQNVCKEIETVIWRDTSSEMLNNLDATFSCEKTSSQLNSVPQNGQLSHGKPITDWKSPVSYDLDELERDITKSLEKILDDSEVPVVLSQYNYSSAVNFNGQENNIPAQHSPSLMQKFNEAYHQKPLAVNSGLNSLQSRLNFLRTKGRPSDFEQFFNPLAFNTQIAAQLIRQENIANSLNATQVDNHIIQLFPKSDLAKMCVSNAPCFQQNPANSFGKDIKGLLARNPQIVQNSTTGFNQHAILKPNPANIVRSAQLDLMSLYSHLAGTKTQVNPLVNTFARNTTADDNVILNQFITSQSLDSLYPNSASTNRYRVAARKFSNHIPLEHAKSLPLGNISTGFMDQDCFPTPSYLESNNYAGNAPSGIRTIISVSDLEKQALEQYRNSEESINARYDILEKEAEEQYSYNCLSHK